MFFLKLFFILFQIILPLELICASVSGSHEMKYDLASKLASCGKEAKGLVLINGKNGKVLFEKEKDLLLYPASTTKIATALYILQCYGDRLQEVVLAKPEALASISCLAKRESNYRAPPFWLESDGGHMGIRNGEEFTVETLLCSMLIQSPNDAANVLAQHFGRGKISLFMEEMNAHMSKLGCKATHFLNPHGLHHPLHMTTAYEMALLFKEALNFPLFRKIIAQERYLVPKTNLEYERTLTQTNKLVRKGVEYTASVIGGKTGTTNRAGKCLVVAAEKEGRLLIASLFGYESREALYRDAKELFAKTFAEPRMRRMLWDSTPRNFVIKLGSRKRKIQGYVPEGLYYDFYPSERSQVKASISWNELLLPIDKDQEIAKIQMKDESGQLISTRPLLAVAKINRSLLDYFSWDFLKDYFQRKELVYLLIAVPIALLLLRRVFRRS